VRFGIIGSPVKQSVSPFLHQWVFEKLGLKDATYRRFEVVEPDLKDWLRKPTAKKLDGFNVTIPLKQAIISHLAELEPAAVELGAVNCVARREGKLVGTNTDWTGFMKALKMNSIQPAGYQVVVLGSGGSARAVVYALSRLGVKETIVVARTLVNGLRLYKILKNVCAPMELHVAPWDASAAEIIEGCDLLINATPIGMKGYSKDSPVDVDLLEKVQVVMDLVYNPLNTRLLGEAVLAGCQTVSGVDMLLHQALDSLDFWLGPQDWDKFPLTELREALIKKITGFKRQGEE